MILIENAKILTMESKELLTEHFILIENDLITYLGKTRPKTNEKTKIINANGNLVMPGLINMHTHVPMTLLRNLADDLNLEDWLFNKIFPIEDKLTPQDIYLGAKLGIAEMIASGTTSFVDMYFFEDQVAKACEEMNMRGFLGFGIAASTIDDRISQIVQMFSDYENSKLVTPILAPHAVYTNTSDSLNKVAKLRKKLNNPLLTIHLNESNNEVNNCLKENKTTPLLWAKQHNLLDSKTIVAHAVHLNEEEIEFIKENKLTLVHNPISNLKISSGIMPVQKLLENNINITLGTDGACSNNTLDMFETLKISSLLAKGTTLNPTALNAYQTLELATTNAAKALQLENKLGKIKEGYLADLIFIDLDNIHHTPTNNIVNSLAYSTAKNDVYTVIINGKIVYENREFKINNFDLKELRTKISNRISKIA
ncbi:amidohydrolase [Mycoplasma buteonis]|uniref:amidohydrolase n=1 Tax=Mycoplasma buteonis TaxID=171280 RepID=UPI00055C08E2|nr:amidohydrolase [Mycoplasma buteonis]